MTARPRGRSGRAMTPDAAGERERAGRPGPRRRPCGPAAALAAACALSLALAPAAGLARDDRPSEEELFGAPASPPAPAAPEPERPPGRERQRRGEPERAERPEVESQLFGAPPAAEAAPPPPHGIVPREREDVLRIGGQLYLRLASTALEGQAPGDWSLSSPNLLDLYGDARPNERVRAFVLARTSYDPTLRPEASGLGALLRAPVPSNPRVVLDQLWVNFDVARRFFVTAGKQHVKWGVGKFWNPTDYLHRVRRDPLEPFDVRAGVTMVKAHLPWERRGWNLYGVAVLEELSPGAAAPATTSLEARPGGQLSDVAVGGRAEVVFSTVELGADALVRSGRRPKFGVDVSAGIWELDVYAEAALRTAADLPRWREVDPGARLDLRFVPDGGVGFTPAVVAGGSWSTKYSDEDVVTVGAEYFFDDSGYDDPAIYPFLLLGAPGTEGGALVQRDPGAFTPFYLGRHYAGAFVSLPSPGRWNDATVTLSVLSNLSDRSAVARLDVSVLALTYLRVEAFAAGHLGARGGELRLGFTIPPQQLDGVVTPEIPVHPPAVDVGLAVRVAL